MCYDVSTQLQRQIKTARHYQASQDEIDYLEELLRKIKPEILLQNEHWWTNGFRHQKLPVITDEKPNEIQFFDWGMLPKDYYDFSTKKNQRVEDINHAKDLRKRLNGLFNSRGEDIFKKITWRRSAYHNRCVIPLSGYYEHHHLKIEGVKTTKKIPYYIYQKNLSPFYMAGLWSEWTDEESGEVINSCSIVTCRANDMLSKIHNRKPEDPRMLVILPFEQINDWLQPVEQDQVGRETVKQFIKTYPEEELLVHPVQQLLGKAGIGDTPEAIVEESYMGYKLPEL